MNNRVYEFKCGIYPRILWICVGTEAIEDFSWRDYLGRKLHHDGLSEDSDAETFNVFSEKEGVGGVLIQFSDMNAINFENVAHESYHAAANIMDFIGAKEDPNNQEPMAYLVGWIAERCGEALEYEKKS